MADWTEVLGNGDPRLAGFGNVHITTGDLAGVALGYAEGRSIWIDANAAGHGWSTHGGSMDLATVVSHELGHMLGLRDNQPGYAVMDQDLEPGMAYLLQAAGFDADPDKPISDAALLGLARKAVELGFDLDGGPGAASGIDWHAGADTGWSGSYSPYLPVRLLAD